MKSKEKRLLPLTLLPLLLLFTFSIPLSSASSAASANSTTNFYSYVHGVYETNGCSHSDRSNVAVSLCVTHGKDGVAHATLTATSSSENLTSDFQVAEANATAFLVQIQSGVGSGVSYYVTQGETADPSYSVNYIVTVDSNGLGYNYGTYQDVADCYQALGSTSSVSTYSYGWRLGWGPVPSVLLYYCVLPVYYSNTAWLIQSDLGFNWQGSISGETSGFVYHPYYFVNDIAFVTQGWGYNGDYEID